MFSLKRMVQVGVASLMATFFITSTAFAVDDIDSSRFIARPSINVEPDASGAFTQSYPFTLPPGRNGMQPSLELSYSSINTDNASRVGYGWSLSLPSIKRLFPHGSDELYTRHDFTSALSGELSDITLTDATHGTYGAKVDDGSYLSYDYSTSETWEVVDKSGMTYTFGGDASARVVNPSDSTQVYEWMLTSIEDALGNTVIYTYTTDGNQVYPESINYTGFGTTSGIFDIEFTLESRSDVFTTYAPGFAVTTSYRVSDVVVEVDGQEVRSYALEYDTGDNNVRSMLASITETATTEEGISSIAREPTTFSYAAGNESWSSTSVTFPESIAGTSGSLGVYLFDMDGDAITDVIKSRPSGQQISLGNGDGTWTSSSVTPPLDFSMSSGGDKGVRIMDVDGDGALDIVYARTVSGVLNDAVYVNNGDGTGWTEDTAWSVPTGFTTEGGLNIGVEVMDIDGDGLPDIVKSREGQAQEVHINNGDGTGWTLTAGYTVPVYFASLATVDLGTRPMDVNGDGLVDLVYARYSSTGILLNAVYLNNGDGTGWTEDTAWSVPIGFITPAPGDMGVRPIDVNADGLVDLVYHRTDGTSDPHEIYLNTGSEWVATGFTSPLAFTTMGGLDLGVRVEDIDGDGIADILRSRLVGSTTYNDLYLADGEVADLMTSVTTSQGSESEVIYASSANGENPELPFVVQITSSVTTDDGLGNTAATSYEYAEGDYFYDDAFNRGFAGFGTVTATDADGSTISYFSQGNSANTAQGEATDSEAQMGKLYRIERTDDAGHVYRTNIDTWDVTNIGTDRDFVLRSQTLELLYGSGSSHVDRATTFTYNSAGNMTQQVEYGEVTGTDSGSVTDTGTDKRTTDWTYTTSSTLGETEYRSSEKLLSYTGVPMRFTKWFYDGLSYGLVSDGLITKQTDYTASSVFYSTNYTYDSYGLLTTTTDPASYVTTYSPDTVELYPASVTDAMSNVTTYTYDYSSGKVVSTTDQNGNTSSVEYDPFDRPLVVTAPSGTSLVTVTENEYDDSAVPTAVHTTTWFDASTAQETFTYFDGFGRVVQTRSEAEGTSTYTVTDTQYDSLGRVESVSLPYSDTGSDYTTPTTDTDLLVTTIYDVLDRMTSVTNVTGTATKTYDGRTETAVDVNGNTLVNTFDAFGRLASVGEVVEASVYTTTYTYNALDLLTQSIDPKSYYRNMTYNYRGARLTAKDLRALSDGTYGIWTSTYNSRGLMATNVSPDGITTTYVYDALGRKTSEDSSGGTGTEISYTYDSCANGIGRVCTVTVLNGPTTDYDYDVRGRVASETRTIDSTTYTTEYTYDYQGGIVEVVYPDNSTATNSFDTDGSLERVVFVDGQTAEGTTVVDAITFGTHGKPTSVTYDNDVVTTYTYDATELYRLSNLATVSGSTTLQDFSYDYDANGNIATVDDASGLYAGMSTAYTYDERSLLTGATATSTDTALAYTKTWTYNTNGTLKTSTDCGTYTYNGNAVGVYVNMHAPTSVCGKMLSYDKTGHLTGDGTWTHTWNALGLLDQSAKTGVTVSYLYDESGNRVSKVSSVSGTTITPNSFYTVDGSSYERNIMAGSLGNVATSTYSGSTASLIYHHKDHLGGTHVETDDTGAVLEYTLYTPFGATLVDSKTGSYENDHKYTGKELDEDTGLYYYGARYYNASLGLFISQDPVYLGLGMGSLSILHDPQSLNSYSYARNNPVANNDPTGEFWQAAFVALGAVWNTVVDPIVTAFSVVQAVQNPSPTNVTAAGLDVGFLLSPLPAGAGIAVNLAQTGSVAKTVENVAQAAEDTARFARRAVLNAERKSAVRQAWRAERDAVRNGGGTVQWTEAERLELLETGRVRGYEGHHINSVNGNPDMAGDPRNIEFVNGRDNHLDRHGGSWQNETSGDLIDR